MCAFKYLEEAFFLLWSQRIEIVGHEKDRVQLKSKTKRYLTAVRVATAVIFLLLEGAEGKAG